MKYYIVTGEVSGDLHGSNLMKSIKLLDSEAQFRFWGGDKMEAAGETNVNHIASRAFMGLTDVIKNLRSIKKNIRHCQQDILDNIPNALILIDYTGFNMKIARFAHDNNIDVHYYIAPKVWAWNTKRVKKITRNVKYLYSILPFEIAFFKKHNINVDYVGNPINDEIEHFLSQDKSPIKTEKKIIALLPGSRKSEITKMLPVMLKATESFKDFKIIIAGISPHSLSFYHQIMNNSEYEILMNDTYNLFNQAHCAIVTSGTATLETALFNVPQVVCYKMSKISYWVGKQVIKIPYISLVNLILDKEVVKELIQDECNVEKIKSEVLELIKGDKRDSQLADYKILKEKIGNAGASDKVAKLILSRT